MRICLLGDGWGAVAAYKSLNRDFASIYVKTNDQDLKEELRDEDILLESLINYEFDFIVCAGYKNIIPSSLLEKNKIINIHYSLLPKYRGLHSTVWAIINGAKELGLTIHEMNQYIDDGPIIHQYIIQYDKHTAKDIMDLCNLYIEENFSKFFKEYINGEVIAVPQLKRDATWVCKRNLDDCLINFDSDIELLKRYFKALVRPYPLPAIVVKQKRYEITKFEFIEANYLMHNGRVVNIDNEGAWIKVKDGFLVVKSLLDDSGDKKEPSELFKLGMRL